MAKIFCTECGSENDESSEFCTECGAIISKSIHGRKNKNLKHERDINVDKPVENKTPSFLESKPVILLVIIVIVVLFFLFYAILTPSGVYSTSLNSVKNIEGNGQNSLTIPVNVYSKLNTPMGGVLVKASTNVGSISGCVTGSDGNCNVVFTPSAQSTTSNADIIISADGINESISVEITPDVTSSLQLTLSSNQLPADGSSTTDITVKAYDNIGNSVPDGTQIFFSLNPSSSGTLSQTYCNTLSGGCQIEYTASTNAGSVLIQATSYYASTSGSITLQELPPYSISLTSSANSLKGDGLGFATITANVVNKINNPVQNALVTFSASIGSISQSCTTDSSGSCSVFYLSPNQAGTAQITASVEGTSVFSYISNYISIVIQPTEVIPPLPKTNIDTSSFTIVDDPTYHQLYCNEIDPYNLAVRQAASNAVANDPGKYSISQLLDIYDWVKQNINYLNVPTGMLGPYPPEQTLSTKSGDCKNQAVLIASMIEAIGGTAKVIIDPTCEHAYAIVFFGYTNESMQPFVNDISAHYNQNLEVQWFILGNENWMIFDPAGGYYPGNTLPQCSGQRTIYEVSSCVNPSA